MVASEYSYKNKNLSYRDNFLWLFDQGNGNLIRVSRKFKLSEFKLTK